MIKLKDILTEGYDLVSDRDYLPALKNIVTNLRRFKTAKILYRGFKAVVPRKNNTHLPFVLVNNIEERDFKGMHNLVAKRTIAGLRHKYEFKHSPVFASFDKNNAKKFGEPYIFIPKGWFEAFQNPNIPDIGLIKTADFHYDIQDLVNGYEKTLSSHISKEAIIDIKQYYLIKPEHIKRMSSDKINIGDVKTYPELLKIIERLIEIEEDRIQRAGPRAFAGPFRIFQSPKYDPAKKLKVLMRSEDLKILKADIQRMLNIEISPGVSAASVNSQDGYYITTPSLDYWDNVSISKVQDAFKQANQKTTELDFVYQDLDDHDEETDQRKWESSIIFTVKPKGTQ